MPPQSKRSFYNNKPFKSVTYVNSTRNDDVSMLRHQHPSCVDWVVWHTSWTCCTHLIAECPHPLLRPQHCIPVCPAPAYTRLASTQTSVKCIRWAGYHRSTAAAAALPPKPPPSSPSAHCHAEPDTPVLWIKPAMPHLYSPSTLCHARCAPRLRSCPQGYVGVAGKGCYTPCPAAYPVEWNKSLKPLCLQNCPAGEGTGHQNEMLGGGRRPAASWLQAAEHPSRCTPAHGAYPIAGAGCALGNDRPCKLLTTPLLWVLYRCAQSHRRRDHLQRHQCKWR